MDCQPTRCLNWTRKPWKEFWLSIKSNNFLRVVMLVWMEKYTQAIQIIKRMGATRNSAKRNFSRDIDNIENLYNQQLNSKSWYPFMKVFTNKMELKLLLNKQRNRGQYKQPLLKQRNLFKEYTEMRLVEILHDRLIIRISRIIIRQ